MLFRCALTVFDRQGDLVVGQPGGQVPQDGELTVGEDGCRAGNRRFTLESARAEQFKIDENGFIVEGSNAGERGQWCHLLHGADGCDVRPATADTHPGRAGLPRPALPNTDAMASSNGVKPTAPPSSPLGGRGESGLIGKIKRRACTSRPRRSPWPVP